MRSAAAHGEADNPYIVIDDLPKVASLKALFTELYRDTPMLTTAK